MSRYNKTNNYLNSSDDEDPLLAGQINTVMDYRNELAGKQCSKFTPHTADYYLTHDFSNELNGAASTSTTRASTTSRTTSRVTGGNPYLDDNFVEAQLAAAGLNNAGNSYQRRATSATTSPFKGSTPWHLPNPRDEDLALAGEINTIVDLREELQAKQGAAAKGNRFNNYLNNSAPNASPEIRRTSVGNPRLNSSYYDQDDLNQVTRTSRGNPRLNSSYYDDLDARQVRRTSTGDPRLNSSNFYEEQNTVRRTSNEDPRLHPSYLLDNEPSQVRRTSTGDPRLQSSYFMGDEQSQVRRTSTGNPRLQQSYFDGAEETQIRRTSKGNPRLNSSYFDNAKAAYEESEVENTIPWHTPDPDMEDQCLAGQMNVLIDYRNELDAKKGAASTGRRVGFSEPTSPQPSYSRSRYGQSSGYGRNGAEFDGIASFDEAADYRTSRRSLPARGQFAFSDDESERESVPWHLPDEGDEDLCLASQINTIIDYRNELKEKQARGSRGKPLMSQQLLSGTTNDLNSSYDLAAGPSRSRGYPPQVESVPWHLPDEGDEDLCLASQINTIIDYRNELKAKNAALHPPSRRAQAGPFPYDRNAPSTMPKPQRVEPRPQPKPINRQPMPKPQPQPQRSSYSHYSTPASPYRAAPQQQTTTGYSSLRSQAPAPAPIPQRQSTSSYRPVQQPQRQYTSYQNESQINYKYVTNNDQESSDEEVSLEEYDASNSLSDERIREKNYAYSKKSDGNRLHKALAHLDNASRILDSV